jgi:5'-nucleotidase
MTLIEGNMNDEKPQILLTNDDGIQSPGLWATAAALEKIGFVTVVAPRDQYSGAGRSMPSTSDGIIDRQVVNVNGRPWNVHSVGGSPAQAVLFGMLEIMPVRPDLVVSGTNYGENLGTGVTVSGTVGAALEGASNGIPSLAVSLQTDAHHHLSYSEDVDFSTAAYFAAYFAEKVLARALPDEVCLLKIDVPANATPETPWEITRLSRDRFYIPLRPVRDDWSQPSKIGYRAFENIHHAKPGTDVHALMINKHITVTPMHLDMTAPTNFEALKEHLS